MIWENIHSCYAQTYWIENPYKVTSLTILRTGSAVHALMASLIKQLHHSLAFLRTLLISTLESVPSWWGLVCVSIRTVQRSFNSAWYQRRWRWNHLKEWTLGIKLLKEMHWRWGPTPDLLHQRLHSKHPTSGTELQQLYPSHLLKLQARHKSALGAPKAPWKTDYFSPPSLGTTDGWHSQLWSEGWGMTFPYDIWFSELLSHLLVPMYILIVPEKSIWTWGKGFFILKSRESLKLLLFPLRSEQLEALTFTTDSLNLMWSL